VGVEAGAGGPDEAIGGLDVDADELGLAAPGDARGAPDHVVGSAA
jgi:hypothetical protein